MLKNIRNKKAQNTAEYAILIALVIGGVVAMQTYAQRALQARVRDTSRYMATTTGSGLGSGYSNLQYEAYYQNSVDQKDKYSNEVQAKAGDVANREAATTTNTINQLDVTTYVGVNGE